jgi:serine/threonine protein kinase
MDTYQVTRCIGVGSFGEVFESLHISTGKKFAIKKIPVDPVHLSREVVIMSGLKHPNIVKFIDAFEDQDVVHIVMDLYPETLSKLLRDKKSHGDPSSASSSSHTPSTFPVKIFAYQILKGLKYLHSKNIALRDLKPANILVSTSDNRIAICDFGSAKCLDSKPSVSYICSRFYRAPELILGSTDYGVEIDMWAFGVLFAEMVNGSTNKHLFTGENSIDQLTAIIKWLGTPTKQEILEMNPQFDGSRLPEFKKQQNLRRLINGNTEEIEFAMKFLVYSPKRRETAANAAKRQGYFGNLNESVIELGKHVPPHLLEEDDIDAN